MRMTQAEMAEIMSTQFQECKELREAGQKEYAHQEDNAFRNFVAIGKELNLPPEQVLWVYAKKHIDGIVAYINGYVSQREDVRGRIGDLIVYLCLLRGMIEMREKNVEVKGCISGTSSVT